MTHPLLLTSIASQRLVPMLIEIGSSRGARTAISEKQHKSQPRSRNRPHPLPCRSELSSAQSASPSISGGPNRGSPSGQQQRLIDRTHRHESWGAGQRPARRSSGVTPAAVSAAAMYSSPGVTEWMFRLGTLYALPFFLLVSTFQSVGKLTYFTLCCVHQM